jgi:hypothetical protein
VQGTDWSDWRSWLQRGQLALDAQPKQLQFLQVAQQ